ncbi:rhodanese [Streptococcus bovimastitidis]|uniref:Rhodanese n=1 Tax=Streptococcus bovimastitidis TaxID=1856638 RepID=A0A1L8MLF5_9STRE|nr:rhodanese-like domain-containing protein [Streptococcus bovimastitidis]OJF71604.1 rhodanese [Streptococcus bovimastitidis]
MKSESIQELANLLADSKLHLIDVREVDEYQAGHVPSAVNLPLSSLANNYTELSKGETLHIICQSGGRSVRACDFLEANGYDVINVEGGTGAWTDSLEK